MWMKVNIKILFMEEFLFCVLWHELTFQIFAANIISHANTFVYISLLYQKVSILLSRMEQTTRKKNFPRFFATSFLPTSPITFHTKKERKSKISDHKYSTKFRIIALPASENPPILRFTAECSQIFRGLFIVFDVDPLEASHGRRATRQVI